MSNAYSANGFSRSLTKLRLPFTVAFGENGCFVKVTQALPHLEGSASASKKGSANARRQWMADLKRLPAFVISTSKARIIEVSPAEGSTTVEQSSKEVWVLEKVAIMVLLLCS